MSQNTQRLGFVKPLAIFINHVGSGMRMAQRVDGSYKGSKLSLEGLRCVKNFCSPFQAISYFKITRSCAALRAADLGLSGQDAFVTHKQTEVAHFCDSHRTQADRLK